jgi:hypothetical protein
MKRIILLSFLFMILSCSNDNDITTLEEFTPNESSRVSINISQMDGFSIESCPDLEDSSFLIKNNSLFSGYLGQYGKIEESMDNSIVVFSCVLSSNGNDKFIVQRFGGIFKTTNGKSISVEAIVEIDRLTHDVRGNITIDNLDNNDTVIQQYNVKGNIKKSGSCTIVG